VAFAFFFGCFGLFLLNYSASSFPFNKASGWLPLFAGLAFLGFAVWWGASKT